MKAPEEVVKDALFAFWREVAIAYPEAKTGDLNPVMLRLFEMSSLQIIQHWVNLNVEETET